MCLTFQMMTLEKYLTNNFDIFLGGTPFLAPQSAASPKMTTPVLPMTPLFYCRILLHSKNVDVCKKLELNPLRFNRDIKAYKKIIFRPVNKKCRKLVVELPRSITLGAKGLSPKNICFFS